MMVAEVPRGSCQLLGRGARPGHACGDYLDWSDTGHHHCLGQTQTAALWEKLPFLPPCHGWCHLDCLGWH